MSQLLETDVSALRGGVPGGGRSDGGAAGHGGPTRSSHASGRPIPAVGGARRCLLGMKKGSRAGWGPSSWKAPDSCLERLGCAPGGVLAGFVACGHQKGVRVRCALVSMCFMPVSGAVLEMCFLDRMNLQDRLAAQPGTHALRGTPGHGLWCPASLLATQGPVDGAPGANPRAEGKVRTRSLGNIRRQL